MKRDRYVWLLWTWVNDEWFLGGLYASDSTARRAAWDAFVRRTGGPSGKVALKGPARWRHIGDMNWERNVEGVRQRVELWRVH